MLKILRGTWEDARIDFAGPMEVTKEEFDAIIAILKTLYDKSVVKTEESYEFREDTQRLGEYFPRMSWDEHEIAILLEMDLSTSQRAYKIGRTTESTVFMECEWVPLYLTRCKEKGILDYNNPENIRAYLKELELAKQKKRKQILLECKICGTYHDPRNKQWKYCYMCASQELREIRVGWDERKKLYTEQPHSEYRNTDTMKLMLQEYPYLEDKL